MRKSPMVYSLGFFGSVGNNLANINGKWVPARPLGYVSFRRRLLCAWLAFTGACDLVRWPEGQ